MMATGDTQDPRQAFLDALTGAGGDAEPAAPEPVAAPPEAPSPAPAPLEAVASTPSDSPPPEPESPTAVGAPPAAAAPPPPDTTAPALMDLGYDAQVQGTALGLRSIANRLQVIAEGLKLIPALQNIGQDLQSLGYDQVAQAVDALVAWAQSEEQALMTELEQRTAARQQPQPST